MCTATFRLVCNPGALDGAPAGWAAEMLRDGEIALQADAGGMAAINAVAHSLRTFVVRVLRSEETFARAQETVIAYAASLPLVWIAGEFAAATRAWARERGPMTLLVEATGALSEGDCRRIERFVALLGRQAE